LEKIVNAKISAARPVVIPEGAIVTASKDKYINYTPSDAAPGKMAGKQRVIRMVDMAVDPLEPPKFKHKKVPNGPPSPPVPVMHSPPRKLTVKDQQAWKIPPVVSNWKNAKGYTIPLDKRLAADGRTLQQATINDKFATLSEALYVAERKARSEVEMRAEMAKRMMAKEKEQQEAKLRELAAKAREERAGLMRHDDEAPRSRAREEVDDEPETVRCGPRGGHTGSVLLGGCWGCLVVCLSAGTTR
jgi:SNW domain-containing protein 1